MIGCNIYVNMMGYKKKKFGKEDFKIYNVIRLVVLSETVYKVESK